MVALAKELGFGIIYARRSDIVSEWRGLSTRQFAIFVLAARLVAARIAEGTEKRFSGVVLFFDEADAVLADSSSNESDTYRQNSRRE